MSRYRDKDVEEFAEMIKAFSNPNRLRILLRPVSCIARSGGRAGTGGRCTIDRRRKRLI